MSWGALRHPDADFPDSPGTDLGRHLACLAGRSDLSPFATDTYAKVGDWQMNRPRRRCMLLRSNCRHSSSGWSSPPDGLKHELASSTVSTAPMAFQFFEGVNVRKALTLHPLFSRAVPAVPMVLPSTPEPSPLSERPGASGSLQVSPSRETVWSEYWSSGVLHSCALSFDGALGPGFEAFWRDAFAGLAAGAQVLDLATGNGALPLAMLRWDSPVQAQVDAIDLAAVRPSWLASWPPEAQGRVRFQSGVRMEDWPFDADRFDGGISQCGFEYAQRSAALKALLRVAKPGALVALVCHHTESLPARLARVEVAHIDRLTAPMGFVATAEALVPRFAQARTPSGLAALRADPQAAAERLRFNALQTELDELAVTSECPDVIHETREAVANALNQGGQGMVREALADLGALRQRLVQARLRLSELLAHALTSADLLEINAVLGLPDGTPWGTLYERDALMAWTLLARLPR